LVGQGNAAEARAPSAVIVVGGTERLSLESWASRRFRELVSRTLSNVNALAAHTACETTWPEFLVSTNTCSVIASACDHISYDRRKSRRCLILKIIIEAAKSADLPRDWIECLSEEFLNHMNHL
jgi:hypothetical protein